MPGKGQPATIPPFRTHSQAAHSRPASPSLRPPRLMPHDREPPAAARSTSLRMTVGATFALSLVVAPALAPLIGVPGIFVMTGVLALAAIVVLRMSVPEANAPAARADTRANWKLALADRELLRLNYGIFALHAA